VRVQVDRYNIDVPIPADGGFATGLIVLALCAVAAAIVLSGAPCPKLLANPLGFFRTAVNFAARRGEGLFWAVWGLLGLAAMLFFTAVLVLLAAVA
jgi:hypothetical protein